MVFSKFISYLVVFVVPIYIVFHIKVNESLHKQSEVTPHFSTGQNLLKKIFRTD